MPDEILKKVESIAEGITEYQKSCDRLEEKLTALDEDKFAKMSDAVAKNIEELNAVKTKQTEAEESQKNLEKVLNRPVVSGSNEICSEAKSAFLNYLRRGEKIDEKSVNEIADNIARKSLLGATEHQIEMAKKDLVVGINPDGGYFVRPQVADFMIKRIRETSPMRQLANTVTISTESFEIPIDDDEAGSGWVGEVDARSTTDTPQIGQLTIHAHEMYASPRATQKMLDDSGFDVESWLQNKVANKFSRQENTAFVVGDGSKKPRGFLDYSAWTTAGAYERGKLEQIDSGTNGAFDGDNLIDVQNSMLEDYQPNATWVMKRTTWREVMKAKDGVGRYLLNPMLLAQNAEKVLLGSPVVFFNDMPAIATDALAIAYGDFREGYTVVDRIGIRVLRDFYTAKPYIIYYTTKRVGGDVTNYQAIKILKLAA